MASQPIIPLSYQPYQQPKKPTVRIALVAGQAVDAALAELPAAVRDATLDEITQPVDLPIRLLVVERNAIIERINTDATLSEEIVATLCKRLNEIDATIGDRAADTADDAVMKLLTLAHITAEGHEVNEAEAERAIVEAHKHFGVGALHGRAIEAARGSAVLPDGYDPYLRGYYVAWQRAYDTYGEHRAKRIAFERGPLAASLEKDKEVRAAYPADYDFRADPAAKAALDAVGCQRLDEQFDVLAVAEHDALERLLSVPAPSPNELTIKLKLFEASEGWANNNARDFFPVLVTDARRFGQHGAHLQSDGRLLHAFAAYRHEMALFKQTGPLSHAEDDAADARVALHEAALFEASASTLEGVLAKLRLGFQRTVCEPWSDHAVIDPAVAEFRDGLRAAGGLEQLLWSSIEDLARIAGVNLSEHGA